MNEPCRPKLLDWSPEKLYYDPPPPRSHRDVERLKTTGKEPELVFLKVEPQFVNLRITRSTFKRLQKLKRAHEKKNRKKILYEDDLPEEDWRRKIHSVDDGKRRLSEGENEALWKRLKESDGFEVGDVPDDVVVRHTVLYDEKSSLLPSRWDGYMAELAVRDYNLRMGTSYKFVKIIRFNLRWRGGQCTYMYMTFQAKEKKAGWTNQIFQAILVTSLGEVTVHLCRLKNHGGFHGGSLSLLLKDIPN